MPSGASFCFLLNNSWYQAQQHLRFYGRIIIELCWWPFFCQFTVERDVRT